MKRIVDSGACLALALWLGGCSTVTGDFHQKLQIEALDAQNRPVDGMQCRVGSGSSAKSVVTPAADVRVRRSNLPLAVECHRDNLVATATVKSRRERMEEALLPFGSVGVFVDHLSGSLYAYPTALHLRVGQHLVLEHGGDAQVAQSEPIASGQPALAAAPQKIAVAVAEPAKVPAAAPTAAPQKPRAAAKADRTATRPAKTASTTTTTAVAIAGTTSGTTAAPAKPGPVAAANQPVVRSAPVNW